MIFPFNSRDWYWFVGGDTTQAYSTKTVGFVPANDPGLVAWQNAGGTPTQIDTRVGLGAVLADAEGSADELRPTDSNMLDGYQSRQSQSIVDHAVTKLLFNHENRIRALEGKAALTPAQFRIALKQLM